MAAKFPALAVSRLEKGVCFGALALLVLIPFAELALRQFAIPIPHARGLIVHLFLVLVFFAAMLTSKSGGHIAIGVAQYIKNARARKILEIGGILLVVFLLTVLAWNTLPYIRYGLVGRSVGPVPVWAFALAMPLGYFVMALRFALRPKCWGQRAAALAAILAGTVAAVPAIAKLVWGVNPFDAPEALWPWMDFLYDAAAAMMLPAILLLALAALAGMPIFAAIGGIATVMLMAGGLEPEAFHIPVFDALTSPDLVAIPLFTLTGFFLSESKAGERLVRTFQVFFSWLPGGIVIVAVLISAFFSSFTGASGVTILALGGILYTIFRRNGYSERVTVGLLTAAGGTGVMFPPSLAIILVFSTSSMILHFMNVHTDYTIVHYFAGAVIPGLILVIAMVATGIVLSARSRLGAKAARWEDGGVETLDEGRAAPRSWHKRLWAQGLVHRESFASGDAANPLSLREWFLGAPLMVLLVAGVFRFWGATVAVVLVMATLIMADIVLASKAKVGRESGAGGKGFGAAQAFGSLRESFLEIMLPVVLVAGFFTGRLTLMEVSAVSVVYVVIVEVFIKRDIALRDIPKVFAKATPIVGGVLIILAMASGLSFAFVDSGVPERFSFWMQDTVHSRLVFLLLLNLALLLVGSVIDMFSAIMVLLPLVVPLGYVYGIDPLHLGIIFILNLEAGFLTPPVGINLFLASSRFEKPFMSICRYALPFFLVRLIVLVIVAYIPWFSTWLPGVLMRMGL